MNLSPDKKIAGVLAPLFGLRSENDLGIGDVAVLREFIDWAAEIGFKVVQLLPINEMGADNSPYNAISAMAIEPTTLYLAPGSPEQLTPEDFDKVLNEFNVGKLRRGSVKYDEVRQVKRALLEAAFQKFDYPSAFKEFRQREAQWLDEYVFFRALMERNGESEAWDHWPEEQQTFPGALEWRDSLSEDDRQRFADRENFFAYVQWLARDQWREVKNYAERRGVGLMGDIPFGVSYYSADVFSKRDQFVLDWCGGAPPETHFKDDKFTQKWGQNWGIPLYRWPAMRERGFHWWRERVRAVANCFHLFRIDHVLGFYRIYGFPWRPQQNKKFLGLEWNQMLEKTDGRSPHFTPRDDSTWENCRANCREGEEYLRIVLDEAGTGRVIGEDLGTVPDYVRPSLRSLGIAGFKIPQWEFYHGRVTAGSEYERLSVATYATHDHPPVRAMWEEALHGNGDVAAQARADLEKIATFADFKHPGAELDFERDFYPAIMHALFRSESWLAVVMITDLLARKYRFNVPGVSATFNWTRRMQRSISQLRSSPKERKRMGLIRHLLEKTDRL
jgi:4-alpha-glucanotransferase